MHILEVWYSEQEQRDIYQVQIGRKVSHEQCWTIGCILAYTLVFITIGL